MTRHSFIVEGPLVGYVRTTQRAKWVDPAYKRYQAFKATVRLLANAAGVPECIDASASVWVHVHWVKRARCDLDNAIKAILDSLWKNDRRVQYINAGSYEGKVEEKAFVEVEVN
jgi:Holliday junction resolvase RusA-like endonuclease